MELFDGYMITKNKKCIDKYKDMFSFLVPQNNNSSDVNVKPIVK